jgi:hypothetical protein
MDLHTGFGINGYDLVRPQRARERACRSTNSRAAPQSEAPDYFPPVFVTPRGLMEQTPISNPAYLARNPGADADPETLVITPGVPIAQDPAALTAPPREPANREIYAGM